MWGIDRLSTGELANTRRRLRSSRVALLSQAAAVDRHGKPVLDALEELGVRPLRVFVPEHRFDGFAQAEESVEAQPSHSVGSNGASEAPEAEPASQNGEGVTNGAHETSSGPEWVSLYGKNKDSLSPRPEHLEGLDVLVIDLMDIGSRYYTFVWSALLAARAAANAGVHTLVLDRPNPISGDPESVEGTPQTPGFTSFVGLEPLPIRHALTLGEILVHFFQLEGKATGPEGALSLVSPRGWERLRTANAWTRPFVAPSPNMPTTETALVYPGGCLIEGTNLSEGRGTTLPFQTVGAPFLNAQRLAQRLADAQLSGFMVRPHSFRPTFEKHAGQICHGVVLHVTDPRSFRPVATCLTLLALAREQAPEHFRFRSEPYEFETDIPAFDLLTGSDAARRALADGASAEDLIDLVARVDPIWRERVLLAEAGAQAAQA
jgi:uncharacterized protein YbbC (DUF1343 family)